MCKLCDAAERAALAEVDALVMLAEQDEGLSVPHATRPLTANERRARVNFANLDRIETVHVAEIREVLAGLSARIREEILRAVFGSRQDAPPEAVVAALAGLARAQPPAVASALDGAAAALSGTYSRAAGAAAAEVAEEAGRQGRRAPRPVEPEPSRYAFAGSLASGALWDRLTEQARRLLVDPAALASGAPVGRKAAAAALEAVGEDGAVDNARQTLHTVTADARNETAEQMEPEEIWASEILDGATCQNCRAVDGKEYATMAEARADYPNGPYTRCDGGARCRGTLVFMFPIGQAPPPDAPPWDPAEDAPKRKGPRGRRAAPPATPAPTPAPDAPEAPTAPVAPPPARKKGAAQRFERIEQLPVLDEPRKLSPLEEAALMNPEHDPTHQSKIYNNNCTNVATAYEMRRRGYDVTAAPIAGGNGRYQREYITDWWNGPDGKPLINKLHTSPQDAMNRLNGEPDGARGYITVVWKGGGGHVFNWEKQDGMVHLIEGQNPSAPDASLHLARARPKMITTVRLDNATPRGDMHVEALQARTPEYIREREQGLHLSSAQKKAASVPQFHMANGKIQFTPAKFRKKGNKWEPIPKAEQDAARAEWEAKRDAHNAAATPVSQNDDAKERWEARMRQLKEDQEKRRKARQ